MSRYKMSLIYALAARIASDIFLLLSGYRVLTAEKHDADFTPYLKYVPSTKIGDALECTYFTGQSFQTAHFGVYDTKPDECPFFFRPSYLNQ